MSKISSIKMELVKKSRESTLAAVQIYNNPTITFKAESFIVLTIISWTYLLHAYYRSKKIEYRYFDIKGSVRRYQKTKNGAYKHWELEKCLNFQDSPIDRDTANNLKFLIGLRHEIEHQMTSKIDEILSARFQAACLNYNKYIIQLFGEKFSISKYLSFSLQFSTINTEQKELLEEHTELPSNILSYIKTFDDDLSTEEYNSPEYAYRVLFVPKLVNHKGQADKVIEFVKSDSPLAKGINKEYTVIKETEKQKYRPSKIVEKMKQEGFNEFSISSHTYLWQKRDGKNPKNNFGIEIEGQWYWYERWVDEVRKHCIKNYTEEEK
ncbi:DUF3644 domain-containing protein [Sulfurimonas xiamenensis]|uniref:DUF3644 domain-containing protein n=1 Tax=Sulfurimonas xiamenensis TaxID=2590021 RepID=A0AAJ4A4H8_9BACT|nr:DUF3644 domain-containing protein [Sulfurimonas xiamenensis]QFR43754.1 DUF3644 domain-containing protein [Sulfurimonas xiamenensis]